MAEEGRKWYPRSVRFDKDEADAVQRYRDREKSTSDNDAIRRLVRAGAKAEKI